MAYFGTNKQHGTGVLASRDASPTANARSCVHGHVGLVFRDWNRVGIGHAARGGADVASCLDDFVEGGAVHHQVADDGESLGTPWLNPDVVAILKFAHVELAGGDAIVVAVWSPIDVESAHAADALATVVVEAHGMGYAVVDELLVQDVKHLKEGAVGRDAFQRIGFEMALGAGVLLTPNMQFEVHSFQLVS